MAKRLYVGNLSYNTSNSDLENLFAPFGTVRDATVVMDNTTGRSKGFGFVEMQSDSEAQAAIAGLDSQPHDGRPLTVNEARPREERRGARSGAGARY
jgi:RNA recognition motif-containing protein